ncbi:cystatin-A-like [Centropristis striata]|uniref:cystatin-A-like n=1 Tax=Centropristis striata TaxID=184440 RepID=UPI0027E20004|nr:cystatin-A-like [Centropristis striata]
MANIPGGWSETKDATPQIQKICDEVRILVQEFTGKTYEVYRAVKYRNQIVAGENFLIKVFVGEEGFLHLCVFQELPCKGGESVLCGVEQHRQKDDPLVLFVSN